MTLINPHSIEELIIACLQDGERESVELLDEIRAKRANTTKQGFYAALRLLKSEETVSVRGKTIALNTAWIRRMQEITASMAVAYLSREESFGLLSLQDKERASYYFNNSVSLDVFWGHSQNIFLYATPDHEPEYCYDPHYWLYIARPETEKRLLREITGRGRQFLISIGGSDPLDRQIKSDFATDLLQYNLDRIFEKENYYITVIGDYITEVFLDEDIAAAVDVIYKECAVITADVRMRLEELSKRRARHRIRISRDAARAALLKKRLGRHFYIISGDKNLAQP